jgi:hypothetical protein
VRNELTRAIFCLVAPQRAISKTKATAGPNP